MNISCIIVARNAGESIQSCMETVRREAQMTNAEVIVVDNGSTDDTLALARAGCPEAKALANAGNRGLAAALNQAIACASGDLYVLINPHCRLRPGAVRRLAEYMDANSDCAVAGGKVICSGASQAPTANRFPGFWNRLGRFLGLCCCEKVQDQPYAVHWVPDVLTAVRPQLLTTVGPFDERFFVGMELADLCKRAWQSQVPDWTVRVVPAAQAEHVGGGWTRAQNAASHPEAAQAMRMRCRSIALYLRKHNGLGSVAGYVLLESISRKAAWCGFFITGQAARRKAAATALLTWTGAVVDTSFGRICPPRPW